MWLKIIFFVYMLCYVVLIRKMGIFKIVFTMMRRFIFISLLDENSHVVVLEVFDCINTNNSKSAYAWVLICVVAISVYAHKNHL